MKHLILIILFALVLQGGMAQHKPAVVYRVLEGTYVATQVLDVYTTYQALKYGGRELNPLMGAHPSLGKMVIFKTIAATTVIALNRNIYSTHPKLATLNYIILNTAYSYVLYNNIQVGLTLRIK